MSKLWSDPTPDGPSPQLRRGERAARRQVCHWTRQPTSGILLLRFLFLWGVLFILINSASWPPKTGLTWCNRLVKMLTLSWESSRDIWSTVESPSLSGMECGLCSWWGKHFRLHPGHPVSELIYKLSPAGVSRKGLRNGDSERMVSTVASSCDFFLL